MFRRGRLWLAVLLVGSMSIATSCADMDGGRSGMTQTTVARSTSTPNPTQTINTEISPSQTVASNPNDRSKRYLTSESDPLPTERGPFRIISHPVGDPRLVATGSLIVQTIRQGEDSWVQVTDIVGGGYYRLPSSMASNGDVAGSVVVYKDSRDKLQPDQGDLNADVYMFDLSTAREVLISGSLGEESDARTDGHRIAWRRETQIWTTTIREITMRGSGSPSMGAPVTPMDPKAHQRVPAASGNVVTWVELGGLRLRWKDMQSGDNGIVGLVASTGFEPKISGAWVVWVGAPSVNFPLGLWAFNLITSETRLLSDHSSRPAWPAIADGIVAWGEIQIAEGDSWVNIYAVHLDGGTPVALATGHGPKRGFPDVVDGWVTWPHGDEHHVAWLGKGLTPMASIEPWEDEAEDPKTELFRTVKVSSVAELQTAVRLGRNDYTDGIITTIEVSPGVYDLELGLHLAPRMTLVGIGEQPKATVLRLSKSRTRLIFMGPASTIENLHLVVEAPDEEDLVTAVAGSRARNVILEGRNIGLRTLRAFKMGGPGVASIEDSVIVNPGENGLGLVVGDDYGVLRSRGNEVHANRAALLAVLGRIESQDDILVAKGDYDVNAGDGIGQVITLKNSEYTDSRGECRPYTGNLLVCQGYGLG